MSSASDLGVAVVGFGWMGQVHARAYERVRHHYPQLPRPVLLHVADEVAERRADAQERFDVTTSADWQDVLADQRVAAVSVTAPNFVHRELGVAVAAAGKHLWIEKPVGLTSADAVAVAEAVHAAGVRSAVGFNYRNAPAVEHARALIADGAIGTVTAVTVRLAADYAAHPSAALSWRFGRDRGGAGVLGDLASHGVDLARFLVGGAVGEIAEVVADTATVIGERPMPSGAGSHYTLASGGELGPVENEDRVVALLRFAGGAQGILEASRVSVGDQNAYGVRVDGTRGHVAWDFRRMGELVVSAGDAYLDQGATTVLVGPAHGELSAFQPAAGNAMSFDDLKVIEAARFVTSIAQQRQVGTSIDDAVAAARVLDAIAESAATRRWTAVPTGPR